MKKLVILSMLVGCFSAVGVSADSFDFDDELLSNVRTSLVTSLTVLSRPAGLERTQAIFDICGKRIKLLRNISKREYGKDVHAIINRYMQICKMHMGEFDVAQLLRSKNFNELAHNANSISQAYCILRDEAVLGGAKTVKVKAAHESKKAKSSHARKGRQERTKNRHEHMKKGRSGRR